MVIKKTIKWGENKTNVLEQKWSSRIKGKTGKIAENTAKEIGSDALLDATESMARKLREGKNEEEIQEGISKRNSPEFVDKMYSDLKKKIDAINSIPANKKYLEEFKRTNERIKRIYTARKWEETDAIKLLKDWLYNLNIRANTWRAKTIKVKQREVDYNDADIDGRWVYMLLSELGMVKDEWEEDKLINAIFKNEQAKDRKTGLKINYLQSKEETTERTTEEWLSINERQVWEDDWIRVKKWSGKYRKNIFENPFKDTIVEINNNLKHSDWPTSSTRMVYEMLKSTGMIEKLPKEKQEHMEKFVYFVDMAYRLKQRILGMDFKYINSTIFGNYKQLNINDIWDYLGGKGKTWFEYITPEEAKKMPIFKWSRRWEEKKYIDMQLVDLLKQKEWKLNQSKKVGKEILNNSLVYKPRNKTYEGQEFIFDINTNVPNADEFAIYLASQKKWFCKLHEKTNEVYVRSYYDLPKRFGPFFTESWNTIHTKLTEENIDEFLDVFEWENRLKKEYGDVKIWQELEVKITKIEGEGKDRKVSLERVTAEDTEVEQNEVVEVKTEEGTKQPKEENIVVEDVGVEKTEVTEEKTDEVIKEPEEDLVVGQKIVGVVTSKKEWLWISVQIWKDNITGLIHVPSIKKQLKEQFYLNLQKQKDQKRLEVAGDLISELPILYKEDLEKLKEWKEINKAWKRMKWAITWIVKNKVDWLWVFVQIGANDATGLVHIKNIRRGYKGIKIWQKLEVKIANVEWTDWDLEIALNPVLTEKQEVELPELTEKDLIVGNKMVWVVTGNKVWYWVFVQIGKLHSWLIYMPDKSQAELDKFEYGERIKVSIKEIRNGWKIGLEVVDLPMLREDNIKVGRQFDWIVTEKKKWGWWVFIQIWKRDSWLAYLPRASEKELDELLEQKRVRVEIKKIGPKGIDFKIITPNPKTELSKTKRIESLKTEKIELPELKEEDVKIWAEFEWVIARKMPYWVFVDIGKKHSWLAHITKIRDIYEKLQPGEKIKVKIVEINKKWEIGLEAIK